MIFEGERFVPKFGNESHIRVLKLIGELKKLEALPAAKNKNPSTLKRIQEAKDQIKRLIQHANKTDTEKTERRDGRRSVLS